MRMHTSLTYLADPEASYPLASIERRKLLLVVEPVLPVPVLEELLVPVLDGEGSEDFEPPTAILWPDGGGLIIEALLLFLALPLL